MIKEIPFDSRMLTLLQIKFDWSLLGSSTSLGISLVNFLIQRFIYGTHLTNQVACLLFDRFFSNSIRGTLNASAIDLVYAFLNLCVKGKNLKLFMMLFSKFNVKLSHVENLINENLEFISGAFQQLFFSDKDRFLEFTLDNPNLGKLIFLHVLAKVDFTVTFYLKGT